MRLHGVTVLSAKSAWPLLLLNLPSCAVCGETVLSRIGWRGANSRVIVGVVLVLVVSCAFFILYYARKRMKEKHDLRERSEDLFDRACKRIGLTPLEVDVVRRLLRHENIKEPQVVLQSVSVFEKCLDREVNEIRAQGLGEEDREAENAILGSVRKKAGFHLLALEHPLLSTRNIAIGQSGAVFGRDHRAPIIHRARVMDSNEFNFRLQYDVDKEEICYISHGDEIKFAFTRQNDSVYGIALRVESADGAGNIVVFHSMELRRNQLRQFVRMDVSLPLRLRLLKTADPDKSEVARGQVVEAKMTDISGGGLSFIHEQSLRAGDLVSANFSLGSARFSGVLGKILRIGLQEGKVKTYYKHHLQFRNIEFRKHDLIVKYVFGKQRQQAQWR